MNNITACKKSPALDRVVPLILYFLIEWSVVSITRDFNSVLYMTKYITSWALTDHDTQTAMIFLAK